MDGEKKWILPSFTEEPLVSALGMGTATAGQGCRLEPRFYVRFWNSSTGTVYTSSFTFTTSGQSWVATENDGTSTRWAGTWINTTGNPAGCWQCQVPSGSKIGIGYLEWTGTWEQLGVPTGKTITAIKLNNAYEYSPQGGSLNDNNGPYELRDSTGTTVLATLLATRSLSGADTSWVTRNGTSQTVSSSYQASTTTVKLRVGNVMQEGGIKNTYFDEIYYDITYA